jgi:hypothetical protein
MTDTELIEQQAQLIRRLRTQLKGQETALKDAADVYEESAKRIKMALTQCEDIAEMQNVDAVLEMVDPIELATRLVCIRSILKGEMIAAEDGSLSLLPKKMY